MVMVSQLEALRTAVAAMDLGPEHQALVAYCEGLAETIDEHPERATLWREYRPALETLLTVGRGSEVSDEQVAFLRLVSGPPMGDTKAS